MSEELGSESPPALVGASLSSLEVPVHSRGCAPEGVCDAEARQSGLFLFGGDNSDSCQTNQLYVYYLQDHKWRKPSTRGKIPSRRSRHSASVVGLGTQSQRLLIFGGVGASNAVVVLDAHTFEWSHPPTRSKPGEKVNWAEGCVPSPCLACVHLAEHLALLAPPLGPPTAKEEDRGAYRRSAAGCPLRAFRSAGCRHRTAPCFRRSRLQRRSRRHVRAQPGPSGTLHWHGVEQTRHEGYAAAAICKTRGSAGAWPHAAGVRRACVAGPLMGAKA